MKTPPLNVTNDFFVELVTINDEPTLVPLRPITHMTKGEGLRLAAWIIALADSEGKEFPRVLEAVLASDPEPKLFLDEDDPLSY
jgi:hypothetical protein